MTENKDFTVDYQDASVLFSYDISGASNMVLTYSFVGVFTLREFRQDLLIDVYDSDMASIEQWVALICTMILTNHDELLEQYNQTDKTEYIANQYMVTNTISRIDLLEGIPDTSGSNPRFKLALAVQGQTKAVKEILDGFGLIEKVHSPGKISDHIVDVDIGVE